MSDPNKHSEYTLPKPEDLDEQARLDLQHQHWLITLEGALYVAPLDTKRPLEVLDAGCGSGAWALSFSKENPQSTVTAVDVNPLSVESLPSNCTFSKVDLEHDWEFAAGKKFDFIHVKMMTVAIRDWPSFLKRCWASLAPGGWLQIIDVHQPFGALNPKANAETSPFLRVGASMELAWTRMGWDMRACDKHPDRLALLGFQSISQQSYQGLIGDWPEAEPAKTSGRLVWENWNGLMGKVGPTILAKALQLDETVAKASVDAMLEDLKSNGAEMQYYFPERITLAQKPPNAA